jgi:hypothetical protein
MQNPARGKSCASVTLDSIFGGNLFEGLKVIQIYAFAKGR